MPRETLSEDALNALTKKHGVANKKWSKAVQSKRYPFDDGSASLTAEEKQAIKWAIVWRRVVHEAEAKMLADPSVRHALAEGATASGGEEPTYHEALAVPYGLSRGLPLKPRSLKLAD